MAVELEHPIVEQEGAAQAEAEALPTSPEPKVEGVSIIVFSGELDKLLAAFTIANGAAAMDMPVTMFFTFWGINALRREGPVHLTSEKTMTEGMFARMMPRGAKHLPLSNLRMAGLGTRMMHREMAKKHIADLPQMMETARQLNVQFIACTMSMSIMGIKKEELIDGISLGGVASYLERADRSRISLFI